MRKFLIAATAFILPQAIHAQGMVVPPVCITRPCTPPLPCRRCEPRLPQVARTGTDIRVDLAGGVLRYEITETFVNRGGMVGEADYLFPLPRGAAFQDLKLSMNGELVPGETINADRAREIYEAIVRQQRDPALVEWMGYGLVRTRIFPIAPGETKKVVVRFQGVAHREGDAMRVDYFTGTRQRPRERQNGNGGSDRSEAGTSFVLTYPADRRFGRAYSPTHAVSITETGSRRLVRTRGGSGEITLLIPVRGSSQPAITVLSHARGDDDGFALVTLTPPAAASRAGERDVTLVLDVSGSMSGDKIRQARKAGKRVLATLTPDDRFRIIDFATDVRHFRNEYVRATPGNVRAARAYLDDLDASGSTNISGALEEALDTPSNPSRLELVLFMTDGEPTVGERDPESIAARVARLRGTRRIFAFGVGAELNAALIERLAMEGRGTAHFVRPDESIEHAVSLVASRLTHPVVTDVRVRAEGVTLLKIHPSLPADVFAGQDLVLLARYRGDGPARLVFDGRSAHGPVTWSTRVRFPDRSRENSYIPRLWATQRVGYLSAEKRRNGGSAEVDAEIRELGERYGIPTEFSSYLVLEPGMQRAVLRTRGRGVLPPAPPSPVAAPLGDVLVTGAATTREMAGAESAVYQARKAAEQRAATNLEAADAAASVAHVRRTANRTLRLINGVWTDTRPRTGTTLKVKPYSNAYFALLNELPELRELFALGDRIVAAGRGVSLEVAPDGIETLSAGDLQSFLRKW